LAMPVMTTVAIISPISISTTTMPLSLQEVGKTGYVV
jgi:hypothetical protein